MKANSAKPPAIVMVSVILLTFLIVSLGVLPFAFKLVMEYYQVPKVELKQNVDENINNLSQEDLTKLRSLTDEGRLVSTVPSLASTIRPLSTHGANLPYDAIFVFGALSFNYSANDINTDFVTRELGITIQPDKEFLAIILKLSAYKRYEQEGWKDAGTFIAMLEPESVIGLISGGSGNYRAFIQEIDIGKELIRLKNAI